jgi:phosphoglycolate phosphatase-like HAD superfamily hydrolase
MGSKAYCIGEIAKKGYDKRNILMCGDAVGDMKAAQSNGVLYYPICVNKENQSWTKLRTESLSKFTDGSFDDGYQQSLIDEFMDNLK